MTTTDALPVDSTRRDSTRRRAATPPTATGIDALSADGRIIRIRPVQPDDAAGLIALHERASDETLYRRFLSAGHNPIAAEVTRLVRRTDVDHSALVAVEHDHIIGVTSYEVLPDRSQAEFAVFVDDAAHGRGIGTLLLEHLGVHARRAGVADLLGEILASNAPMLRVTSDLDRKLHATYGDGMVEVQVTTSSTNSDALDDRDLAAGRHSLAALFAPRCVAVIGVEQTPGALGRTVLRAILDGGFTGTVYAVEPGTDQINGVPCYPTLAAAPMPAELVVITVPRDEVAGEIGRASCRERVLRLV